MANGKPRFKTIGSKLTEARRHRDLLNAAAHKGELVTPLKLTFHEVADAWLNGFAAEVAAGEKAERTLEHYRHDLRVHVLPRLGPKKIQAVSTDDIAELIGELRVKGLAAWTIRGVLTPLGRVFNFAARRGYIGENPVRRLETHERPRIGRRDQRVLRHEEILALLSSCLPTYRPLLTTAVYTGMRLSELLGLAWEDVDLDGGLLRVRHQLSRRGGRTALKSEAGRREIPLLAQLSSRLKAHRLASPHSHAHDFVFCTSVGTPHHYRNVEIRGLDKAAQRAGLNDGASRKLCFHDLRHTFASHLIIDLRLDVAQVSRILGHAKPAITLDVYTHLFDQARHSEDIRQRMAGSSFGRLLDQDLTNGWSSRPLQRVAP
jgi:integrase